MKKITLFIASLFLFANCSNSEAEFDATGNFEADEIIERGRKLTYEGETIDIIHALFTNDEDNQFANEGDCWIAYG